MLENLYEETEHAIITTGHSWEDVRCISLRPLVRTEDGYYTSSDRYEYIPVDRFKELAKDVDYDSGYGGEVINLSLRIDFIDGFLSRAEYDGSEWWEYTSFARREVAGEYLGDSLLSDYCQHCKDVGKDWQNRH